MYIFSLIVITSNADEEGSWNTNTKDLFKILSSSLGSSPSPQLLTA